MMVGLTKLMFGLRPLMLYNGEVSCQTLTGKINIMRLTTHNFQDDQDLSEDEVYTCIGIYNYEFSFVHACVHFCMHTYVRVYQNIFLCIHTCLYVF